MKTLGLAVLSVALTAATAASAQVITRQISDMPVETTITRMPDGSTTITRRVLPVDSATVIEQPVVVEQPVVRRTVTRTVRETPRRSASRAVRSETRVTTRRAPQPVYAMAAAGPLTLSAADRDIVYREIVQTTRVAPAPILAPFAPLFPPPPTTVVETATPAVTYTQPVRTTYVVGARLPADIRLMELPATVISRMPTLAPYAYASVDGRMFLVDPQTGIIVADITS